MKIRKTSSYSSKDLLKLLLYSPFLFALFACGGDVAVNNDSGGSATLNWDAPTTNFDAGQTPLTDLSGYKIYYGTSSANYTTVIDIGMPSCQISGSTTVCTHTIGNLGKGSYYFAVKAYDTSNNESEYSDEVSKTIL